MRTYHALALLFVFVFTQGALERLGLPDAALKITLMASVLLVCFSLWGRTALEWPPGLVFVVLFVFWTVLSGIASGDGLYRSFLYFRLLVFGYLVFWAVWNARLTRGEIVGLGRLIFALCLLQIAASLVHVFVLGERVEAHVGTLEAGAGTPATAFPLLAMAYVMAFYFYYKRSAWMVLLAFAFGIVGYSSGKRAIYFLMPTFYALLLVWYCVRERSLANLRQIITPFLVCALFVPVMMFGLTDSKQFGHLQGAGIAEILTGSFEVVGEYNNWTNASGETSGRNATSLKVLSLLPQEIFGDLLLGLGPASMKDAGEERGQKQIGIDYGLVDWSIMTLSIGWPGLLFHMSFFFWLWWKLHLRDSSRFNSAARALYFGCHLGFAAFFILYFFYGGTMFDWITFLQLFCVAIILSPNYQRVLQTKITDRILMRRSAAQGESTQTGSPQLSKGAK